jgi:hypothetical protein
MTVEDFWGDLPAVETSFPATILREQAELLERKTNGTLQAKIVSIDDDEDTISYEFDIIAPALNGYIYTVLEIFHDAEIFPLTVKDLNKSEEYECRNEQELKTTLKQILGSDQTKKVIANLIAMSTSLPSSRPNLGS